MYVLDLTGAGRWFRRARWSPVSGCSTVRVAERRAKALVQASAGGEALSAANGNSNHAFFERRAVDVMTAYALAAGPAGDKEPVAVLGQYPQFAAQRRQLEQAQLVVEETRSGIWETLGDAVTCLTDPET